MRPQFIHKFERLGCLTPGTTSGVPEDRGGDDVKASGTYFAWALGPPGLAAVAFAPSSPETPDAFRLSEALEAGCIPIADCRVLAGKDNTDFGDDYWTWFFGEEPPFPVLSDYKQLHGYTGEALANWKPLANTTFAWWMRKRSQMAYWLESDLLAVGGAGHREARHR
jgi:hypothetical protein